ncbi:Transcription factor mbp1 [Coemansia sp. RSA 2320]|nr:Transcription factor mbp1 [Coemansia sp. RSA 2320]
MAVNRDGNTEANKVWSASYAGIEVFQQLHNNTAVMRRRVDSFVNVTHILKCAQYDKPHRTRFLEREIHTGEHEKIQGGYGKYQGTWVPLSRAISLAKELNIYESLKPLFEYNPGPGDSVPTAPRSLEAMTKRKHTGTEQQERKVRRRAKVALSDILNQGEAPGARSRTATPHRPDLSQQQQQLHTPNTPNTAPAIGSTSNSSSGSAGWAGLRTPASLARTTSDQVPGHGYRGHSGSGCMATPPAFTAPVTPTSNYGALGSGGGGRLWLPSPRDDGAASARTQQQQTACNGRALRDISNMGNVRQEGLGSSAYPPAKQTPRHEPGMLTPPTSVARRTAAHTPTYSRPPAHSGTSGTSGIGGSAAGGEDLRGQLVAYVSQEAVAGLQRAVPAALGEFIQRGAGLRVDEAVTGERQTVLHLAARHGHWGVVRLLMQRGADAGLGSRDGVTPLMLAASQPHAFRQRGARVFEWLLDVLGASLIRRDKRGRTVAHWLSLGHAAPGEWAAASRYYAALLVPKLLAARHAEVLAWRDYDGCSAAQLASSLGLPAVAELLSDAPCRVRPEPPALERARSSESTVSLASSESPASRAASESTVSRDVASRALGGSAAASTAHSNPYDAAAWQATELICAATAELRSQHVQARKSFDADTQYAAHLLLELSGERDAAQAEAGEYAAVAQACDAAQRAESELQRRVGRTVWLQHTARAAVHVYQHGSAARGSCGDDAAGLRAEYARLRQQAASLERSSQQLAGECAELAGGIRPWASGADALRADEQRLHKLERVVAAACGDLPLDRVRTVVGPVLSVLNNGSAL